MRTGRARMKLFAVVCQSPMLVRQIPTCRRYGRLTNIGLRHVIWLLMTLVLGAGRSCDTHVRGISSEQVNATYMPKSVTTISGDRSFGQKRMCSGLSPGHLSGPKISQRDVLEIPMDFVQVHARYNRTGGRKIAQRWFQSRVRDGRQRERTEARRRHLGPRNRRAG